MRSVRPLLVVGAALSLLAVAVPAARAGADPARGSSAAPGAGAKKRGPLGGPMAKGPPAGATVAVPQGEAGEGVTIDGKRVPKMGDMWMKEGNYRAAAAAFAKELKTNPDAIAAHVGLGRAFARAGRCPEALEHLWPYVDTRPFGDEAALAASTCSDRLGLHEDALYFDELAVSYDPDNVRALSQYALDLDRAGEWGRRDAVLDQLLVVKPDRDASSYARAVIALRRGDMDELDAVMWSWTGEDNSVKGEKLRLAAQSWLDIDDPYQALEILRSLKLKQRGVHIRDLRAEALRRLGDPDGAWAVVDGKMARHTSGADVDAVRARILVDQGDIAGARERLREYDESDDPDVLASFWYLAQATGDQAGAARYARQYRMVQVSPLRTLGQLIELAERK